MDLSSDDDDDGEAGRGPLDHLPDVREAAPGVSASSPVSPGGGGVGTSGLAITHPGAEADTPETRALGKHAVSPMGLMAEVERAMAGRKRQAEAPALAPLKALKVSASATARWVVDAQARATKAAAKQMGDEAPTPREAVALEAGDAEAPTIVEATKGEARAPRTSEAEVVETKASRTTEAEVAETGASRTTEVKELEAWSLGKSMFLRWERDAATLAARIEELEEELTWAAGEQETFRSRAEQEVASAKAVAEQLEAEKGTHLLTKGVLEEAIKVAETSRVDALAWKEKAEELEREAFRATEASRVEVQRWKEKAEGLEKEASKVAEASVEVQAVLEAKIREHNVLQSTARTACKALEVCGVKSGSSLGSHLIMLSGHIRERLWGALHTGIKRALAVISSHYVGIDLEAISDGYVVAEDDEKAKEEVLKLVEAAEAPGMELAPLFEEEVIPPTPTIDAGDPV
ncbi:uncharacterized protein [Miscanthus floridulus]|uniref:uncharacterized protein n=1 Tax=Miscanthus floridulus TaxID=154761 RepID=UPI003457D367